MTDISNDAYLARLAIVEAAAFASAPHVLMKPRVFPDGDAWCALLGDNLAIGVSGFGSTPAEACADFDKAWWHAKAPPQHCVASPSTDQQSVQAAVQSTAVPANDEAAETRHRRIQELQEIVDGAWDDGPFTRAAARVDLAKLKARSTDQQGGA